MVWERNGLQVLQRGGSPHCRDTCRRDRERERGALSSSLRKHFLKAIHWENERDWFLRVSTTVRVQRLKFWKSMPWLVQSPTCTAMLLWRRRADSLRAGGMIWGSPGMHWVRRFPLLGVHLGEVALPLWGQKSWQAPFPSPAHYYKLTSVSSTAPTVAA